MTERSEDETDGENGKSSEGYEKKLEKGSLQVYNVGPRGWQQSGANGRQRGTRDV